MIGINTLKWSSVALGVVGISSAIGFYALEWPSRLPPLVVSEGNPIDVGTRLCGDPIRSHFELRNPSNRPIAIQAIRKYCGCIEVDAGRLPRTLEAGAAISVAYVLAPPDSEGTLRQFIDFDCDSYEQAFRVELLGRARQPLPADIQLGSFDLPHALDIRLAPEALARGCLLAKAHSMISNLSVSTGGDALLIYIAESALGQQIDGAVDVEYRDGPVESQRIWVHGLASGGLIASPDTLQVGMLHVGLPPVTHDVQLRDGRDRPFELASLSTTSDAISVECVAKEPSTAVLRVSIQGKRAQAIDDQIIIQTSDPRRRLVVRCLGMVEEPRHEANPRGLARSIEPVY